MFDVDGDGSVAPLELARAAELYKDSKDQVKRLTKLAIVLLLLMGLLLGCITGLVFVVVEGSKETATGSSGVQTVKGSDTPVSTGSAAQEATLYDLIGQPVSVLKKVTLLAFSPESTPGEHFSYTITGYHATADSVTFYSARGDVVVVTDTDLTVAAPDGTVRFAENKAQRRRLLQKGGSSGKATVLLTADVETGPIAPTADGTTPTPPPAFDGTTTPLPAFDGTTTPLPAFDGTTTPLPTDDGSDDDSSFDDDSDDDSSFDDDSDDDSSNDDDSDDDSSFDDDSDDDSSNDDSDDDSVDDDGSNDDSSNDDSDDDSGDDDDSDDDSADDDDSNDDSSYGYWPSATYDGSGGGDWSMPTPAPTPI